MKEYGNDLLKRHKKLKREKLVLTDRVRKRRDFLIKNAPQKILDNLHLVGTDDVELMLVQIISIEKAYVRNSKQLDLFNKKE